MALTSCSLLRLQPGTTGSIQRIEGMNQFCAAVWPIWEYLRV